MKKDDAEIVLTDETRLIVASYLAKRQKGNKTVSKKRAEFDYDFKQIKKK